MQNERFVIRNKYTVTYLDSLQDTITVSTQGPDMIERNQLVLPVWLLLNFPAELKALVEQRKKKEREK